MLMPIREVERGPIMPTNHTVTISVVNGQLSYSSKKKRVLPGDFLQWTCDHDFAIQFANKKSPFTPKKLSLSAAANTNTASLKIRKLTKPEKKKRKPVPHEYFVAVFVGGTPPILTDDPIIIIDDTGGG
jgi:hypothetical protein